MRWDWLFRCLGCNKPSDPEYAYMRYVVVKDGAAAHRPSPIVEFDPSAASSAKSA